MPGGKFLSLDHRRADVFLSRVASLTPAEWGRLDAAAARLKGSGLLTRWKRARRFGAAVGYEPWLRTIATSAGFVGEALFDSALAVWTAYYTAESIVDADAAWRRVEESAKQYQRAQEAMARPLPTVAGMDMQRMREQLERLFMIARRQPGHKLGDAADCLFAALYGVLWRPNLMADAFEELYGPVEPVISASSLDDAPDPPSPASSATA